MVPTAAAELKGSGVKVASVATAFLSGRSSLEVKLADTKIAIDGGADEIDMVIDRGAFWPAATGPFSNRSSLSSRRAVTRG